MLRTARMLICAHAAKTFPCDVQNVSPTKLMSLSSPPRHLSTTVVVAAIALALAGCAVGTDYVRPSMGVPTNYKESVQWGQADPKQIDSNHNWWEVYGDNTLSTLRQQANQANQSISQAEAQYRQARAAANVAGSGTTILSASKAAGSRMSGAACGAQWKLTMPAPRPAWRQPASASRQPWRKTICNCASPICWSICMLAPRPPMPAH